MKKLTFALACASTLALFATDFSVATFEGAGLLGQKVGAKDDNGSDEGNVYWQYKGASGSEDSSVVTAYGGENLPAPTGPQLSGTPGDYYLNLSTEGGTLWRSVNPTEVDDQGNPGLGAAQEIASEGQMYIDTMVQFTATEDGGTPDMATEDKLAVWLDKSVDEQTNAETLTLCVRAAVVDDAGGKVATTFKITNAAVEPGTWYRLSVKAFADITGGDEIPGFEIRLDGKVLVADQMTLTEDYAALIENDDINAKTRFASLRSEATVQAVGFKGSGAVDDVTITEDELFGPTVAVTGVTLSQTTAEITVGKTLTLTAEVAPADATDKTVKWTTSDETIATVVDGVVTAVAAGEVTITAKAGDQSATCKVTVNPAAKQYPEYIAEADKFKYDAWVSAYGVTDRVDTDKALQAAYLLNVAPADAAAEEDKFAITSITVDAAGNVTVVASKKNSKGLEFNGEVEILGATALNGEWAPKAAGHKFFKAVLK